VRLRSSQTSVIRIIIGSVGLANAGRKFPWRKRGREAMASNKLPREGEYD